MNETVTLVLTYRWFDLIASGEKRVEYRRIIPYWTRRIWNRRDNIVTVRFSRGYTRYTTTHRVTKINIGPCPYDGWDGVYYRIHFNNEPGGATCDT
jgi:hypothetical protein